MLPYNLSLLLFLHSGLSGHLTLINLRLLTSTETMSSRGNLYYIYFIFIFLSGKGKAVPLQAWSDPEGSRKLRFPDFMTTAQDGGKVVSLTQRPPLHPGNAPDTHFC